jgi:sporulation protein YlmC with PRC-barrel domain
MRIVQAPFALNESAWRGMERSRMNDVNIASPSGAKGGPRRCWTSRPFGDTYKLPSCRPSHMSSTKSFRKEDIEGKTVVESSGKVMGKVKDLLFSLDGTITLVVTKEDGSDVEVSLSKVMGVSDHVVVKIDGSGSRPPAPPKQVTSTTTGTVTVSGTPCKFCDTLLAPGVLWCPSCGRSQG